VRITDITVVLHERSHTGSASFGPARPVPLGVLRIQTDEGIEGNGDVHAPAGPGVGAEIDWDLINSAVIATAA
jgi:L-alanine-DL-glutamate epimerase-like enolase superfamily enzyme